MPMGPPSSKTPSSLFPTDEAKRRLGLLERLDEGMERVRNSLHHPNAIVIEQLRAMSQTIATVIAEIEGKRPPDTIVDARPPSVILGNDLSHLPPPPAMPAIEQNGIPKSSSNVPR